VNGVSRSGGSSDPSRDFTIIGPDMIKTFPCQS